MGQPRHAVGATGRTHYDRPHVHMSKEIALLPDQARTAAYPRPPLIFLFRDHLARFACNAASLARSCCPMITFIIHELRCDRAACLPVNGERRAIGNSLLSSVGFRYPLTAGWVRAIGRAARTTARSIARRAR